MGDIWKIITTEKGKTWDRLVTNPSDYEYVKPEKKASLKETFDFYIKQSFINGNPYLPGLYIDNNKSDSLNFGFYVKRYDRIYDRYLSENLKIDEALSDDDIKNRYDEGKGNEFKNGKYYSVASSSRFATACFSENIKGIICPIKVCPFNGEKIQSFEFEKGLNIPDIKGTSPQMDVYFETENDIYYIEVKCHEIFDSHESIKLKSKYKNNRVFKGFLLNNKISTKGEYITKEDGEPLTASDFGCVLDSFHFDFKQFLCHLMGVLSQTNDKNKQIHFYYLFYKNDEFKKAKGDEGEKVYRELVSEIKTVLDVFRKKSGIDINCLYHNRYDTMSAMDLEWIIAQTPFHN